MGARGAVGAGDAKGAEGAWGTGGARGASYALFSAQYPPHVGGIEHFTQGLARELCARGARALVVTNDTEGLGDGLTCEDGVDVLRLPCRPLVSGRLPLPRRLARRRRLLDALAERPLDGVLVNARFYPHSLLGMRFARSRGLTPVVLDHGSDYLSFSNALLDPVARIYERVMTAWGRRYGAAYYGISERSVAWLGELGISAAGVIPNALDAAAYRSGASGRDFRRELGVGERPLIAFLGRLIPEKGVRAILEAARDEQIGRSGAAFVLAGDGPLADEARAAGGNVHAVGALDRADAAALLTQADLLLLPSRSEGFATTLLEAAACGCPMLVTDVGGAREVVVDGRCGSILPDARPQTIAREVLEVLAYPEELRAMGDRARVRADDFSWEATARAFERACAQGRDHD